MARQVPAAKRALDVLELLASMSKARVVGLTRSLAAEHLKPPLRINAIAPAGTRTNIAASNPFPPDMDPTSPAA